MILRGWTPDETLAMRRLWDDGLTDAEIAAQLDRTPRAVAAKRKTLGVMIDQAEARARAEAAVNRRHAGLAAQAGDLFAAGVSIAQIARRLGRDHSTVGIALRKAGHDTSRGAQRGAWQRGGCERTGCAADPHAWTAIRAPDVAALYAGRRYDADDVRLKPARLAAPVRPATHVATQSILGG